MQCVAHPIAPPAFTRWTARIPSMEEEGLATQSSTDSFQHLLAAAWGDVPDAVKPQPSSLAAFKQQTGYPAQQPIHSDTEPRRDAPAVAAGAAGGQASRAGSGSGSGAAADSGQASQQQFQQQQSAERPRGRGRGRQRKRAGAETAQQRAHRRFYERKKAKVSSGAF